MRMAFVCASILAWVAACGNDGGSNPGTDGGGSGSDGGTPADAYVPPTGYTKLIQSGTWTLPPGSLDSYKCVRLTLTEDTYITNIEAQAPTGTHHTVLSISNNNTRGPDGEYDCSVSELGTVMLYASGVGTSPLDFPAGVGIKIPAGEQIHLNLHLFNASDDPISGSSGIWVKSQSTPPPTLAEMVFAGRIFFAIPGNAQNHPVTNTCDVNRDYTLFALWPHMHQIAIHQKVELIRGTTTTTLHDMPYTFSEQEYYLQNPEIQVQAGDKIRVTCRYNNPSSNQVFFGDSSNTEMCFSGMYRYPAADAGLFECTDQPGFGG